MILFIQISLTSHEREREIILVTFLCCSFLAFFKENPSKACRATVRFFLFPIAPLLLNHSKKPVAVKWMSTAIDPLWMRTTSIYLNLSLSFFSFSFSSSFFLFPVFVVVVVAASSRCEYPLKENKRRHRRTEIVLDGWLLFSAIVRTKSMTMIIRERATGLGGRRQRNESDH